jgi:GT2 family glycosyltransferase
VKTQSNQFDSSLDILLVLWRELDDIHKLFDDLKNQSFQNYKVHVSLNDPNDEVRSKIPKADNWHYYEGPNDGYAGGLQRIWPQCQSEWILISNTDIRIQNDFLETFLLSAENSGEHIGYLGPKVLYEDGRLQSAGGLILGPEGLCKPRGIGSSDCSAFDHLTEVPVLSGCCFMIRKKVLEEVNGFDSNFFMYVEDVHLFLKAIWAGWMGLFVPQIEVVHAHGGSNERYGKLHLYHLERNHWWLIKQLPFSMFVLKPFYLIKRWLLLAFFNKTPTSKEMPKGSSVIAIKALIHGLFGMPRMLFQNSPKKISTKRFNEIFRDHRITLTKFLEK